MCPLIQLFPICLRRRFISPPLHLRLSHTNNSNSCNNYPKNCSCKYSIKCNNRINSIPISSRMRNSSNIISRTQTSRYNNKLIDINIIYRSNSSRSCSRNNSRNVNNSPNPRSTSLKSKTLNKLIKNLNSKNSRPTTIKLSRIAIINPVIIILITIDILIITIIILSRNTSTSLIDCCKSIANQALRKAFSQTLMATKEVMRTFF